MIVGLDISMASTGLAWIDRAGLAASWTVKSAGTRADDLDDRSTRLVTVARSVVYSLPRHDVALVVVEAPSYGSVGAGSWDRAGLWWLIVTKLHQMDLPVAMCAPATRAKYATGKGNSDKVAVAVAASKLFPNVQISNSDEADALVLAHIGATRLGYPVQALQRHHDALKAVHFPHDTTPTKGTAT